MQNCVHSHQARWGQVNLDVDENAVGDFALQSVRREPVDRWVWFADTDL
jgi:hypothetical protein